MKVDPSKVITAFTKYVEEWHKLDVEYYRIPSWRIFKQLKNIRQREKLTRVFTARMKHYGVIKDV